MKIIQSAIFLIIAFSIAGCDQPGGSSGIAQGVSYTAFWSDKERTISNLELLVLSDFKNENSPAKGQALFGSSREPLSGYHDRDGEIVSFAETEFDSILILDKYLPLGETPVFYVYRDANGFLDVKPLTIDSKLFQHVYAEIEAHNKR